MLLVFSPIWISKTCFSKTNKLPCDVANVVGIKGGGGPKGTESAGTDDPLESNVIGTCDDNFSSEDWGSDFLF